MRTPDMFPETKLPRQPRRVLMHVCDAGVGCGSMEPGEQWVQYECTKCELRSEWQTAENITTARRGIPCPQCNKD